MASYEVVSSKHATLDGTTPDTIRMTGSWRVVEVINRDEVSYLYVKLGRVDQGTITAGGDETLVIPPRKVLTHNVSVGGGNVWVSVVGTGTEYSVQGID